MDNILFAQSELFKKFVYYHQCQSRTSILQKVLCISFCVYQMTITLASYQLSNAVIVFEGTFSTCVVSEVNETDLY